jgi:chemotaxis protein CheD
MKHGEGMKQDIKVGIADYKTGKAPDRIITLGLGSCVGICIYDRYAGAGGMAHIMLPDSSQFQKVTKEEKFADLAIPKMVNELTSSGLK